MTIISISLSESEAETLKAQAKAEGVPVSQYVRGLMSPKTTKIRKCIREQKGLPKSVAISTICLKKETYTYNDIHYTYIYDVNHVFVDDGTLYPINPGYAWENSDYSVGMQSILYAVLCSCALGSYLSKSLWDEIEKAFEAYIAATEKDGIWIFKFNMFTFRRVYDSKSESYTVQLIERS